MIPKAALPGVSPARSCLISPMINAFESNPLAELEAERRSRWHVNGNPIQTGEDARAFVESAGMVLVYPAPSKLLVPTLVGAVAGSQEGLPGPQQAFTDPRARRAHELVARLVEERAAFAWPLGNSTLLVSASLAPFFYALSSDRMGKQEPAWAAGARLSRLAHDAGEA